MIILGITGNIGSGKTRVAELFSRLGARVVNADKIAHRALNTPSVRKKIVEVFGKSVLNPRGNINRSKLGNRAFAERKKLIALCRIVHPPVIDYLGREIKRLKQREANSVLVIDAPLLIEADFHKKVDKVIVVKTSLKTGISRCRKKSALTINQIRKRAKAQMPLKRKLKFADYIIDNEKNFGATKKQVIAIWQEVTKNAGK